MCTDLRHLILFPYIFSSFCSCSVKTIPRVACFWCLWPLDGPKVSHGQHHNLVTIFFLFFFLFGVQLNLRQNIWFFFFQGFFSQNHNIPERGKKSWTTDHYHCASREHKSKLGFYLQKDKKQQLADLNKVLSFFI